MPSDGGFPNGRKSRPEEPESRIEITIWKIGAMYVVKGDFRRNDFLTALSASQGIAHAAPLPSNVGGYPPMFLFLRQATSPISVLLRQSVSCLF
jgi:hypothetical protein